MFVENIGDILEKFLSLRCRSKIYSVKKDELVDKFDVKSKKDVEKLHTVQALYATPALACFFLIYFILGGYVKYNFLEWRGAK